MASDTHERLKRYDLNALLALAERERLIHDHERTEDALVVTFEDERVTLNPERALLFVRGIIWGWALNGGEVPPSPNA